MQIRFAQHYFSVGTQIKDKDSKIIFALCSILFIPAINNFINSFLQIGLSIHIEFLTPAAYIFMALMSVGGLYKYLWRKKSFILLFFLLLAGVIISYQIYPEIRTVIYNSPVDLVYSPVNKLFFFCIPALIGVVVLNDYQAFFNRMCIWGKVTLLIGLFTYCFVFFYAGKSLQYMVFSYFMLLPICVCFESAKIRKSKFDFLIAILGSVSVVMCGARGAVISLVLYFLSSMFFRRGEHTTLARAIAFYFSVIIICISLFYHESLLLMVSNLFRNYGIDSRIISYMVDGMLFEDTGRNTITNAIYTGIYHNPFGYGVFGDRYVVGTFGTTTYTYAHNIFNEMLCDFGIPFGTLMIIILSWRLIRTMFRLRHKNAISLLLVFLPYGLFQLFFSSSFLENIVFFMLIGMSCLVKWDEKYWEENTI